MEPGMRPCLRSNPSAHARWCWVEVPPLRISVSVWRPISRPRGSNLIRLSFSSTAVSRISRGWLRKPRALTPFWPRGGGKVLDAGKLLAHRLSLPCITVPLSASTCAGWTALSNIYSSQGAFKGDVALNRCPDLLVFDHGLVRQAPPRTLASGVADALAKWYEASVSSGDSSDGLVQQAVQMARVLRDQLLIDSLTALKDPDSEAWVRTAEACALTAGVMGGLGGARCRTVAAHAVHNGLTQLQACHHVLHGEKVGFGILVQLRLEERLGGNRLAGQAHRQLLPLLRQLGLPVSLDDLGLAQASLSELQEVCRFACRDGSDLHHLPFAVTPGALLEALVGAAELSPSSL